MMSAQFAMNAETIVPDDKHDAATMPAVRQAGALDAPVESPVHQLQDELLRLNSVPLSDLATTLRNDALPGWLQLSLPVALSLVMWAVILRAFGVIG
jgi:hypothetical protein